MTANSMGDSLQLLFEASTGTNRQFNSREKSFFLNMGMTDFINKRTFPDGNTKQKGLESDNKRILDLAPLLGTTSDLYFKIRDIGGTNYGDFVRGTYVNGAMRNPDKDADGITDNETTYGTITDAEDMKYGVLVELRDEVLFIVSQNCDLSYGTGTNKQWRYNVRVDNIPNELYNDQIYNSFKQPYFDLVWKKEFGKSLPTSLLSYRNTNEFRSSTAARNSSTTTPLINPDWYFNGTRSRILQLLPGKGWEVEKYNVTYIKKPNEIVVDYVRPDKQVHCELHPQVHYEVIQLALRFAAEAIIPSIQKYQVVDKENKENE